MTTSILNLPIGNAEFQNATIDTINGTTATIGTISSTTATIGTISSTTSTIGTINGTTINGTTATVGTINGTTINGTRATIGTLSYQSQYVTPISGSSITAVQSFLVINPAATLSTLTLVFPASPLDGQDFFFTCTQIVTTLTINGNGKTLSVTPSSLNANDSFTYRYNNNLGRWFKF